MTFKKTIKEIRLNNRLSKVEMAKKLDVSEGTKRMWENGKNEPRMGMIEKIANLFNVSKGYLLGEIEESNLPEFDTEIEIPYYGKVSAGNFEEVTIENESIIDIDKIMNQRKKYHELYAMDMMQEEELFTFIKETDVLIAQYDKEKDNQIDVTAEFDKVENVKNIIADTWENLNVLEKQEFINLSVKNIYVTYVRGKRGQTPNSINIDDIMFY